MLKAIVLTLGILLNARTERMTVYEVSSDLVTVEDASGELLSFYGDGFAVGETVRVTITAQNAIIWAE